MIHHTQPQLSIFCSSPKPEIKPDLNFVPAEGKIHMDFISPYLGLLDLPNKNTASPVKFEFQIHNEYTFSIWPMKYWGHTDTKKLFVYILAFSILAGNGDSMFSPKFQVFCNSWSMVNF